MNLEANKHYTNEHGMELKDFMKAFMPELWESACYWSALKYNVRAGKKAGEALEKDTGKRDDYIKELIENDGLEDYSLILADLDGIKERFENWKGKNKINIEKDQHYINKNGKQLNDFLEYKFSYEQMKAWYTMQVMKYLARAGLKTGESEEKDRNKALDYSQELATLINDNKKENIDGVLTKYGVLKICQNLVDEFKEW